MSLEDAFIRRQQAKNSLVSTGDILLDRAFKIPLGQTLLIRGEKYSGCTAILFQLLRELLKTQIVCYVDPHNIWHNSQKHRWGDIENLENLFVLTAPSSVYDIMEFALASSKVPGKVWILDGVNVMKQGDSDGRWFQKNNLQNIVKNIKKLDPKGTIIYAQSSMVTSLDLWSVVVSISIQSTDYYDNFPIGHVASVNGPLGKSTTYISYKKGRISPAYNHAISLVEQGVDKNSVFELDGIRVRGFNQFIRQYNETLIGAHDLQEIQ